MDKKFVHLHTHTEYSLLDGLSKVNKLLNYIKENSMDSVAITDHGVMYGIVEFYKAAKKAEVKPILGMEGYMTNGNMREKAERGKTQNFHLLLLAKNDQGYKNLMKLSSLAHLEGYYYRPRFDREALKKYSEGLIVTSACPQGEVGQALIKDSYGEAKEIVEWFTDVFGEDYYLEVQRHNFEHWAKEATIPEVKAQLEEIAVNSDKVLQGVIKLSRELGVPLVATNDAHYIKKDDAPAQDALVCIATGKNTTDIKRMRYIDSPDFYIKTPDEMSEIFSDFPEAIENTVKIAEKCNVEIVLGKWFFPNYNLPEGKTADEVLRELAKEKLLEKFPDADQVAFDRLEHELNIICTKGYAPYFLIVRDMVFWAAENGIITNTRGSAAGSLVSFVLGITTVDPLKYYLPFERFLNPFRPTPPDIDFDVSDIKREEVIKYMADTYGHDKVAQICTFGRMLARGSVRDVARVLGYPYSTGDRISKSIPLGSQGFPMTINKALETAPDLKAIYDEDKDAQKIIDMAKQIEGNARHISVHAAGVVVAPSEITDFSPVQREPSGEKVITQYEMHASEDVGLIKFDILGIRNLSILGAAVDIVEKMHGFRVNLREIPLDDKKTFEMLSRGETMGVFQLSGGGMTKYLKDLKPERIEDLMAMVALYRPGPMSQIPEYIARKNNRDLVKYLDPRMEKFLGASYGLIVYQDDLLFCALDLAGYTWEEADKFRKAVGKKIPEEMAAQKEKFTKGIIEHGQTENFAEDLWKLFEPFQSYGFNKAHAASYGMVAYQTAYMKANYPVEYMTALMTAESDDAEKVAQAVNECRRMNIKVLAPDINKSHIDFTIVEDKESYDSKAIRFGLSAIKNVGKAAIEAILESRQEGEFRNFSDFLARADSRRVNKKVLESLIKVGALSDFGKRAVLLASLDEIRNKVVKKSAPANQDGLFGKEEDMKVSGNIEVVMDLAGVEEFSDEEIQNLERQLLGLSLSAKPINELLSSLEHMATHKIEDIMSPEGSTGNVKIAAVVSEVRTVVTKKNNQEMAFVKVNDGTGSISLVVFPKIYQSSRTVWVDNNPILITGKLDTRDDEPSIIVEKIMTDSESYGETNDKLFVRVPSDATEVQLKSLKEALITNPGSQSVTLNFPGNKNIDLPFKVTWTKELAGKISEIFHPVKHLD